jgi:catalase (peroxidase I)
VVVAAIGFSRTILGFGNEYDNGSANALVTVEVTAEATWRQFPQSIVIARFGFLFPYQISLQTSRAKSIACEPRHMAMAMATMPTSGETNHVF